MTGAAAMPIVRRLENGADGGGAGGMGLQGSLATGFGALLFCLTCLVMRRGWLDCFSRARQHPLHRAYLNTSTAGWVCAICLHSNPPMHKLQCVMCATDASEIKIRVSSSQQSDPDPSDSAFCLIETPKVELNEPVTEPRTERQQAAIERHEWKRCIQSDGVHWIRVTGEDVRRHECLRGTFVSMKEIEAGGARGPWYKIHRHRGTARKAIAISRDSSGFVVSHKDESLSRWLSSVDMILAMSEYSHIKEIKRVSQLAFTEKTKWFYLESLRLTRAGDENIYTIHVHREHILKQSMQILLAVPPVTLRRHLRVNFMEEPGIDGGGILREWLHIVCTHLFAEPLGLFVQTNNSEHPGYWINREAGKRCRSHLEMFTFFGKLLGKALLEGLVLNVRLSIPLLKHLLGVPLSRSDLRYLDEHIHTSVEFILTHDRVDDLALSFSVAGHDLVPGGTSIDVTEANKAQYVDKLMRYYLFDSVEKEVQCISDGLHSVIPGNALHIFDYRELDLVMSGLSEIDLVDWKANAIVGLLGHDQRREKEVVSWFWEIAGSLNQQGRSRLLQYVTGSSGLPVEGFAGLTGLDGQLQPFTLQLTDMISDVYTMLPFASTCSNRLDIPLYKSKEEMEDIIHMVIQMDVTGFNRR